MKSRPVFLAATAFLCVCASCRLGFATTESLSSPNDLPGAAKIDFENYAHHMAANLLYQNQGIKFSRDDGQAVLIYDYNFYDSGRITSSPPYVLATVFGPGATTFFGSLNVTSSTPLLSIGAYFGNDQDASDFFQIRLSAFGPTGELLGATQVVANGNTHVDQFIGIHSTTPFSRVRFDNLNLSGFQTQKYSVVIDDLIFVRVPEPTSFAHLIMGLSLAALRDGRRSTRRNSRS